MAKTKYFGYTLRNAGTPCQQWVLNELPIYTTSMFTSTTTTSVDSGSILPISSVTINQAGGRINADGSFNLPVGLYKIEYFLIVSSAAAGPVAVNLNLGTTTVSQVQGYTASSISATTTYTDTISGTAIVKIPGCSNCGYPYSTQPISLVNGSSVALTPVTSGSYTIEVIITKIA